MGEKLDSLRGLLAKIEAGEWSHTNAATWLWNEPGKKFGLVKGAFDGSLDAAKALHEAVLPGHGSMVMLSGLVEVWPSSTLNVPFWGVSEANPARAWLIAILKALIAEATE